MSFEYIVNENKTKTLTDAEVDNLPAAIAQDFDNYNMQRQKNIDMAEKLTNEIFFANDKTYNSENKYENWKTKIKMCKH